MIENTKTMEPRLESLVGCSQIWVEFCGFWHLVSASSEGGGEWKVGRIGEDQLLHFRTISVNEGETLAQAIRRLASCPVQAS